MAMKESSKTIFNYIKENADKDITAVQIAEALGMETKSVNGSITGLQRKGWVVREEVAITGGKVKYVRLTDEGAAADVDAE